MFINFAHVLKCSFRTHFYCLPNLQCPVWMLCIQTKCSQGYQVSVFCQRNADCSGKFWNLLYETLFTDLPCHTYNINVGFLCLTNKFYQLNAVIYFFSRISSLLLINTAIGLLKINLAVPIANKHAIPYPLMWKQKARKGYTIC